jgi:hypothetical protein
MVGASALAAVALPAAFALSPPVEKELATAAGWSAVELYWPAVGCVTLSSAGSALLLAAAARNSPPLLVSAGTTAAAVLAIGLSALFPTLPAAAVWAGVMALAAAWRCLVQLSLTVPLLYAALVGVSAAADALQRLAGGAEERIGDIVASRRGRRRAGGAAARRR